eukprot:g41421.t1
MTFRGMKQYECFQRYLRRKMVQLEGGSTNAVDSFRIWTSNWQIKVTLKVDTDWTIFHLTSSFAIGESLQTLLEDNQRAGKGMWKLNMKLLTPEHVKELKRDDTDCMTLNPDSMASQSLLFIMLDDSTQDRLDELTNALESTEKNKTPKTDGLLADLYSALWDLIGQDLLEVYDSMLLVDSTCKSNSKDNITLIYKRKTPRMDYLKVLGIWFGEAGACPKTWVKYIAKVRQKLDFRKHSSIVAKNLVIRNDLYKKDGLHPNQRGTNIFAGRPTDSQQEMEEQI